MQRELGVRHVCADFNGVDRLTADVHASRQVRRANASALAYLRESVFNSGFCQRYFLNCTTSSFVNILTERALGLSSGTTGRKPLRAEQRLPVRGVGEQDFVVEKSRA